MKLLKCTVCQDVYELTLGKGNCIPTCCGKEMRVLKAGEVDAAAEKHVPAVSQDGNLLKVVVGDVAHPMLEKHYITAIWVEYADGTVDKKALIPDTAPEAVFDVTGKAGNATVYEYCNLHGLWKKEFVIE